MRGVTRNTWSGLAALSIALGCGSTGSAPETEGAAIFGDLGEPISGLSSEQLESFERGHEVALRRFTPETGLGPEYNLTSCGGCHEKPVLGGSAGHYRDFLLVGNKLLTDNLIRFLTASTSTLSSVRPPRGAGEGSEIVRRIRRHQAQQTIRAKARVWQFLGTTDDAYP